MNYNGQIIQISRGNLISRLKGGSGKPAKALAFGELFIHTGEKQNISSHNIHDKVTNSTIQTIFTGDLFAGCNNTKDVYFLGSGGSLKWGGIVYSATNYQELAAIAMQNPEHIFMYNGDATLENSTRPYLYDAKASGADAGKVNGTTHSIADSDTDPTQIAQLDRSYVATSSSEYQLRINPGDLLFYSSALDQVVVIHLSRSTDALTKINVDALVSESMAEWLHETAAAVAGTSTEEENYDKVPSTLKTLLDGPVRHYQYLVDQYGWKEATVYEECSVVQPDDPEISGSKATIVNGKIRLPNPHDGEIYYVPFRSTNTGYNVFDVIKVQPDDGELLDSFADTPIREGDLLFALPQSDGKVKFAVVSLYGALLDKFRFDKTIKRADKYATDIWEFTNAANDYEGDHAFQVAHQNLSDFIERLFTTKVDIDPTTHKIIASQLPDFLLGAPKYMGHFEPTASDWSNFDADSSAEAFAKYLLASGAFDWENLDDSEDDTGATNPDNEDLSALVNDKLKTGCYWIYQGETIDVSQFPGIFHTCAVKDDYASGAVETELLEQIATLKAEIDTINNSLAAIRPESTALNAKITAIQSIQAALQTYRTDNDATTADTFTANVTALANAANLVIDITDVDTPADTDITVDGNALADELATATSALAALDEATLTESKTEKTTELTSKQADLEELRRSLNQHLLNKGDWVIYNGAVDDENTEDDKIGRFEIIDNSSSFIGILVKNVKVAGVAEFKNQDKLLDYTKAWKTDNASRVETTSLQRSEDIDISAANDTIVFQNKDKVFAAGPDFLDSKYLPRISEERTDQGNATLINSRFMIIDETDHEKFRAGLGVHFPTGYKDVKDVPDTTQLLWHYAIPEDRWLNDHEVSDKFYSFFDTYNYTITGDPTHRDNYIITTKERVDVDQNGVVTGRGLNFDWIAFMGTVLDSTQYYSFAVTHETDPKLYLPSHSGVLATETYVNQGFTVVKTIVNDLYEKLLRMTTRGHVDWLQTIREYTEYTWADPEHPDMNNRVPIVRHELCDSRVLQERDASYFILKLFYEQNITDPYQEYDQTAYNHKISGYREISTSKANSLNATMNYRLGTGIGQTDELDNTTPVLLNPSTPQADDLRPEQVLPNHSGILLNNNSVIDGGEW